MKIKDELTRAREKFNEGFDILAGVILSMSETEDIQALTMDEVAALLRLSRVTIYRMCKDGRLMMVDERIPRRVLNDYLDGKRPMEKKRR